MKGMTKLFTDGIHHLDRLPGNFRSDAITFNYNNIFFHVVFCFSGLG